MKRFLRKKRIKVKLGKLFIPFLILLAVVVISLKFSELQDIFALFARAKWPFLVLALFSQMINVAFQAQVYNSIMKYVKFAKFKFSKLYKMVITASFLNFSIPSFGQAGNLWLFKKFTAEGHNQSKSLLVIVWEILCYYGGLIAITIYSLGYIYFKIGDVSSVHKIVAAIFIGIVLFVVFGFKAFFKNKEKAARKIEWLNNKIKVFSFRDKKKDTRKFLKEFYRDLAWLKRNKLKFVKPISYQILKFISDALTISLIFLAFGFTPTEHLALGLVAFTFGRILGVVSMIPGGVGAFEGAMILLFSSFGIPISLALTVTLVYRFYSYWIYFPFGLLFSKDWKKENFMLGAYLRKRRKRKRKKKT